MEISNNTIETNDKKIMEYFKHIHPEVSEQELEQIIHGEKTTFEGKSKEETIKIIDDYYFIKEHLSAIFGNENLKAQIKSNPEKTPIYIEWAINRAKEDECLEFLYSGEGLSVEELTEKSEMFQDVDVDRVLKICTQIADTIVEEVGVENLKDYDVDDISYIERARRNLNGRTVREIIGGEDPLNFCIGEIIKEDKLIEKIEKDKILYRDENVEAARKRITDMFEAEDEKIKKYGLVYREEPDLEEPEDEKIKRYFKYLHPDIDSQAIENVINGETTVLDGKTPEETAKCVEGYYFIKEHLETIMGDKHLQSELKRNINRAPRNMPIALESIKEDECLDFLYSGIDLPDYKMTEMSEIFVDIHVSRIHNVCLDIANKIIAEVGPENAIDMGNENISYIEKARRNLNGRTVKEIVGEDPLLYCVLQIKKEDELARKSANDKLSMKDVSENALRNGITPEDVKYAESIEKSTEDKQKEGESLDDN